MGHCVSATAGNASHQVRERECRGMLLPYIREGGGAGEGGRTLFLLSVVYYVYAEVHACTVCMCSKWFSGALEPWCDYLSAVGACFVTCR